MARKKQPAPKSTNKAKKPLFIIAIAIVLIAFVLYWLFATSATAFDEKSRMITIEKDNTQKSAVLKVFEEAGILQFPSLLGIAGAPLNIWDKMKPGRYEIKKGQTVIIRFYGCSKKESGLVYGRINEISCIPLYDSIRIDIVFADDQETIYRKFGCPDEITCSAQIITDEKRLLDRIINKTIY